MLITQDEIFTAALPLMLTKMLKFKKSFWESLALATLVKLTN